MINVYYFSGTGHTKAVANYFAEKLCIKGIEIPDKCDKSIHDRISIIVFPVYCQNVPSMVSEFIKNVESEFVVFIATYGKISHGNALVEANNLTKSTLIGAAYIPMEHTYLCDFKNFSFSFDTESLEKLFIRIKNPQPLYIKKHQKNFFSNFFPDWRSRVAIKIIRNENCKSCNICSANCSVDGIKNGITNHNCIRCLKCVVNCPYDSLSIKKSLLLDLYLKKTFDYSNNEIKLYL